MSSVCCPGIRTAVFGADQRELLRSMAWRRPHRMLDSPTQSQSARTLPTSCADLACRARPIAVVGEPCCADHHAEHRRRLVRPILPPMARTVLDHHVAGSQTSGGTVVEL